MLVELVLAGAGRFPSIREDHDTFPIAGAGTPIPSFSFIDSGSPNPLLTRQPARRTGDFGAWSETNASSFLAVGTVLITSGFREGVKERLLRVHYFAIDRVASRIPRTHASKSTIIQ